MSDICKPSTCTSITIESSPLLAPNPNNINNTNAAEENSGNKGHGGLNNKAVSNGVSPTPPGAATASTAQAGVLIKKVANASVSIGGLEKRKMMMMTHLAKRPPVDIEFKVRFL